MVPRHNVVARMVSSKVVVLHLCLVNISWYWHLAGVWTFCYGRCGSVQCLTKFSEDRICDIGASSHFSNINVWIPGEKEMCFWGTSINWSGANRAWEPTSCCIAFWGAVAMLEATLENKHNHEKIGQGDVNKKMEQKCHKEKEFTMLDCHRKPQTGIWKRWNLSTVWKEWTDVLVQVATMQICTDCSLLFEILTSSDKLNWSPPT